MRLSVSPPVAVMMGWLGDSINGVGRVSPAVSCTLPALPCSGSRSPETTSDRPSANAAGMRNSTTSGAFMIKSAETTVCPSGCRPNRSSGRIDFSRLSYRPGVAIFCNCVSSVASGVPGAGLVLPVASDRMRPANAARRMASGSSRHCASSDPSGTLIALPDILATSVTLPL